MGQWKASERDIGYSVYALTMFADAYSASALRFVGSSASGVFTRMAATHKLAHTLPSLFPFISIGKH